MVPLTPAVPANAAGFSKVGESVKGRPIVAKRLGDPAAPFKVLVVGSIPVSYTHLTLPTNREV